MRDRKREREREREGEREREREAVFRRERMLNLVRKQSVNWRKCSRSDLRSIANFMFCIKSSFNETVA